MQVRVGSTLSDLYDQEQGVPQGGVLSTTLFNIKINDIVKCLDNLTDCSLYVDDFCICFRSKSMRTIERHLQQNLNKIEHWATNNGFKFSKSKTQCVHFCQLRKQHDDPVLTLYGSPIPVVQEYKYLGLIFDKKLSFIPHIKYLKAKCLKSLNILKVLSHTTWGADRTTLLQLYRSLIRSKLDYGSIVYGSARKSYLAMLDPIHHQGLRLALGAFRTSPTASLYVEADEPSLNTRREKPYHLVAVSGAHFTQGTILIVIIVSSGSAKSRTHQSAVGGFLVTRRGWPGRLRACRIWTFINSV